MIMIVIIMTITRLKIHDDVDDLVDELFNSEEVVNEPNPMLQEEIVQVPIPMIQEETVQVPIPMPQEEIVQVPIPMIQEGIVQVPIPRPQEEIVHQFALGVGIISPMAPKSREMYLNVLGRSMPSTQFEFYPN